ncbi:phospholipid transport system transporter-binding protein [Oryzisolibacter propanilivorax]|uniref:Phospholipid transport system transporter-binding protein n=1 Tax=Oryzisolibacter propanilivorax TaxID=1527607 RepID=A0A1G9UX41_9BURK|nr:STAS domain-containing protein [Oryzisolibacter propanilivorax]SDM64518.1 phospholipid transport system transporter-binding protein [Oryzisolibacter propanilivorax]
MLTLPAELTQRQARACAQQLLARLPGEAGPVVVVDAQALATFDSSALAVLLECRRAAVAAGRTLAVQGMPTHLASLAELYGVHELLPVA